MPKGQGGTLGVLRGTLGYSGVLKSGSAASSGVVHRLHAEVVGCASCCMLHPTRHRACRMPRVYRVVSLRQIALIRRVRLLLPRRRGLRPTLRLPHSDRCAGACVPCLSPPPSPAPPRPALSLWTCEPALVRVLWWAAAHTSCASIFCAAAADSCTKNSYRAPAHSFRTDRAALAALLRERTRRSVGKAECTDRGRYAIG